MASLELPFGPPSGDPSVYLDTSHSDIVDATASELSLYIPGDDFVLKASYERLGPDLLLSGEEYSVLVKGYFTHERAPDLYTTVGSSSFLAESTDTLDFDSEVLSENYMVLADIETVSTVIMESSFHGSTGLPSLPDSISVGQF